MIFFAGKKKFIQNYGDCSVALPILKNQKILFKTTEAPLEIKISFTCARQNVCSFHSLTKEEKQQLKKDTGKLPKCDYYGNLVFLDS